MRYMTIDNHGQAFPVVGFVDSDGEQTEDLSKAQAVVVQVAPNDFVGVPAESLTIYTVH